FVVDNDGSITNVRVLRGIGSGCDEEALRVIKSLPKWIPGKIYGIPVRIQYSVPVSFALQQDNDN
ncbi:MAG TPA: energy transducer TonB, partial [Mucilaginibacter sp.]|nr:energy transducer TonB [Mucilaginibacter sp.]